jgi:hypothetical protein
VTSPLPPADEVQPDRPTLSPPLRNGDWPAAPAPALARWTPPEVFIGFTTVALLISLFLPWFSETARVAGKTFTGSVTGTSAHGYLWLVFVLSLIVLLVLIAPDFIARVPARLPSHQQLILWASVLSFLLVMLAFIARPAAATSPSGFGGLQLQVSATYGWSYGAYIALIAVVLASLAIIGSSRPRIAVSQ